ncbi:45 kDa calcium-binding protein [Teleopsis dalmanni]|uniref:45 kDa calcium-binding protein n=1 Tax=Teleopsis dalmanni TaxID=139649 RepID=UPI0018CE5C8C|nr:45 kDa calcium-binding protein [Teleopsis dalmanni]
MSVVKKLSKTFRWLRWSTVCAILFYMFFIGLILHSTTYKLQSTLRSQRQTDQLKQQDHNHHQQLQQLHQEAEKSSSVLNGNNVLHAPPETSHAGTLRYKNNKSPQDTRRVAAVLHGGRRQQSKSSEPETVILAASSGDEKHILRKAFKRADLNHNSELTIQELALHINKKIIEHIEEAIQLNPREFQRVDISPPDGVVTWDEYHRFFLKEHGMTDADIDEHNEIRHTTLNRKAREDMMRDKARWSEAARTDLFSLTIDEYLSFRHPESSISNLLELVDDLLRQFDQDGDDQLSIEEFSEVNMDDDDDLIRKSLISKTVVERREEFKRIIDKNNDGKADRGELLNYVNPKTPRYALQEAATLFALCDENKDGKLTLDEITANAEIFLTSKMIDTANSFHTEF